MKLSASCFVEAFKPQVGIAVVRAVLIADNLLDFGSNLFSALTDDYLPESGSNLISALTDDYLP